MLGSVHIQQLSSFSILFLSDAFPLFYNPNSISGDGPTLAFNALITFVFQFSFNGNIYSFFPVYSLAVISFMISSASSILKNL